MRVPPEIIHLILEWSGETFSLKHFFELRLVNKLFENEILYIAFASPRRCRVLRNVVISFNYIHSSLKRKYLCARIEDHQRGRSSIFSVLFHRALDSQLQKRSLQFNEEIFQTKQKLIQEMVDEVDFQLFETMTLNDQWALAIQNSGTNYWLAEYDSIFPQTSPNVNIILTRYLLLRIKDRGLDFIERRIVSLIELPRENQDQPEFADTVLTFAVATASGRVFDAAHKTLGEEARSLTLMPYLKVALKRRRGLEPTTEDVADFLVRRLLDQARTGSYCCSRLLRLIANAMGAALEAGETEVVAIIGDRISSCKHVRDIDALFIDIYHREFNDRAYLSYSYRFTSDDMQAMKEQASEGVKTVLPIIEEEVGEERKEVSNVWRRRWHKLKSRVSC